MKNWLYSYYFIYCTLTSVPAAGFVEKIEPQKCYFLYFWDESKQVGLCLWHFRVWAWLCAVFCYSRTRGWGRNAEFLVLGGSRSRNYHKSAENIHSICDWGYQDFYVFVFCGVNLNFEFLCWGSVMRTTNYNKYLWLGLWGLQFVHFLQCWS